jgi:hypothetical protein
MPWGTSALAPFYRKIANPLDNPEHMIYNIIGNKNFLSYSRPGIIARFVL